MKITDCIGVEMIKELYDLGVYVNQLEYVYYCVNVIDRLTALYDSHLDEECYDICNDIYNMTFRELKEYKAEKHFYDRYFKKNDLVSFIEQSQNFNLKLSRLETYIRDYGQTPLIFSHDIKVTKDVFNSLYILYNQKNTDTESSVILLGGVDRKSENLFFIADTVDQHLDNRYNLIFMHVDNTFRAVMHRPLLIDKGRTIDKFNKDVSNNLVLKYLDAESDLKHIYEIDYNTMISATKTMDILSPVIRKQFDDDGINSDLASLYDRIYNKYNNLNINSEDIATSLTNAIKAAYKSLVNDLAFKYDLQDTSVLITDKLEKFIHE